MQKRNANNRDRQRGPNLSRREALKAAAAAAGLLLVGPYRALAQELPRLVSSQAQEQDGVQTFTITTRTDQNLVIKSVAEPKKLTLTLTGTIPNNEYIRLTALPREGEQLDEEQQRAKEAAERLLQASGNFVEPLTLEARHRERGEDQVIVKFLFAGAEDPARRIELSVRLKDARGNVVRELGRTTADHRIVARENAGFEVDRAPALLSKVNHEHFKVPPGLTQRLGQVELSLREQ